jgi:nucleotide-binding universal stress UspA family protein
MANSKKVLVAVDWSAASRRAVRYVADVIGGQPGCHAGLIHLELPPRMLEWGGSEDPEIEDSVSTERARDYQQIEKEAIKGGQELLQGLQGILTETKIDVTARLVQFEEPLDPKHITIHILKIAVERDYGTVVVGRHAFSGLKRFFQHDVAEQLVRTGEGVTVWVVK